MVRLSSNLEDIRAHYAVVVVGSGYGGAILASRLARAGQAVCVLERGKEILPGEFPNTEREIFHASQFNAPITLPGARERPATIGAIPDGRVGPAGGMFDYHLNARMNALVGCGLGGTSLINANVAIRPDPRIFADARWPKEIQGDLDTLLADGFRRAEEMLRPRTYPEHDPVRFPLPNRLKAMREAGQAMGASVRLVPLNVSFEDGVNHVGVAQSACRLCGDCVSGCNHGAKSTLAMNYLPDAKRHGASIFTGVRVRRIARDAGAFRVHFQLLDARFERVREEELFVGADVVILAAGCLGTAEILLRSRAAGLPLSDEVGRHFSANRNVLGFGFNTRSPIDGIGAGERAVDMERPQGPCITATIDLRDRPDVNDGLVIEDGSVPGGVAKPFLRVIMASAAVFGEGSGARAAEALEDAERDLESLFEGPYRGALAHTLTLLGVGHDDSPGTLHLEHDRIRVAWPEGRDEDTKKVNAELARAIHPLGGTFVHNPIWSSLTDHAMLAVHPLGGAVIADDASRGAVNHKGQVFSSTSGTSVHEGLYVVDGSVLPRSVGLNPLLTISALAERAAVLLARDRGWSFSYDLPTPTPMEMEAPPSKLALLFSEVLRGHFSKRAGKDFSRGEALGREEGSSLTIGIDIAARDLDRTLGDPAHPLRFMGWADAPTLSSSRLLITEGTLALFVADPSEPRAARLVYGFTMTSVEGLSYFVQGTKLVHRHILLDTTWSDLTTVFTTVHDGSSAASPILGQGILRVEMDDFLRQLSTLEVRGAAGPVERARALLRFGEFCGWSLLKTHTGFWDDLRSAAAELIG